LRTTCPQSIRPTVDLDSASVNLCCTGEPTITHLQKNTFKPYFTVVAVVTRPVHANSMRAATTQMVETCCEYCQSSPMSCWFKQTTEFQVLERHPRSCNRLHVGLGHRPEMRGISVERNLLQEDSVYNDFVQYLGY
jgi:hypothetical protein